MIPVTHLAGKRVAVFGLGMSGLAAAQSLIAGGAEPVIWDDKPESREAATKLGLALTDLLLTKKLNPGEKILLTAFGAGLTWGALLLTEGT